MDNLSKKDIKRKNIAKSCCSLFSEFGFIDISISKLASTAGIGKGTIYEYFENKEDIVFELMSCLQEDYDKKFNNYLKDNLSKEDKILQLFDLFINKEKEILIQKEIYKQFLIICLFKPSEKILTYNTKLRDKYINLLENILNNKQLSINIYDTIIGFFIASNTLINYNLELAIKTFVKTELAHIKEDI